MPEPRPLPREVNRGQPKDSESKPQPRHDTVWGQTGPVPSCLPRSPRADDGAQDGQRPRLVSSSRHPTQGRPSAHRRPPTQSGRGASPNRSDCPGLRPLQLRR